MYTETLGLSFLLQSLVLCDTVQEVSPALAVVDVFNSDIDSEVKHEKKDTNIISLQMKQLIKLTQFMYSPLGEDLSANALVNNNS